VTGWDVAAAVVGVWVATAFGITALWVGFVTLADWYYRRKAIRLFRRQLERM